jgi:hypothetical protein
MPRDFDLEFLLIIATWWPNDFYVVEALLQG